MNVTLSIPHDKAKTIALIYRSGYVTAREQHEGPARREAQQQLADGGGRILVGARLLAALQALVEARGGGKR